MKDEIINIINFEKMTSLRSSMGAQSYIPSKNSLVKLIPLEYLKHGVKVLIEGKLFIAVLDGHIPIKEEIIAYVANDKPFTLSLNLLPQLKKNEVQTVESILKKLNIFRNSHLKKIIPQIIKEGHYIIKSKVLMLNDILDYVKTEGLEYSLMMDLVWNHDKNFKYIIEDLFNNLFDEPFEQVCEEFYSSVKGLLFLGLPHYIAQSIAKNLIYDNNCSDSSALLNKSKSVFDLIKLLNSNDRIQKHSLSNEIRKFSEYGSKYILQKSVFKNYDYFPDFVILKRETELILVHYNIKRVINENKQKVYKILFKNKSLPFSLKGIFRDTFLDADVNVVQMDGNENTLDQFQEDLFAKWGFRSEIYLNKHGKEEYYTSKINSEVNKLIS